MAKLLLLNGPNLNLLGTREPAVYGKETLADIEQHCTKFAKTFGHELIALQYNGEGELVTAIQQAKRQQTAFIILNAGAYTHTSIALRDALSGTALPFIEVHISNVFKRETFRQHSYLSDIAVGVIAGLGTFGYELAVHAANHFLATHCN